MNAITTYRCRPDDIEAMQWVQPHSGMPRSVCAKAIVAWVKDNGGEARYETETPRFRDQALAPPCIAVRTINGFEYAEPGDYVVKGSEWFAGPKWDETERKNLCRDFYPVRDLTKVRHVKLTWEPTVAVAAPSVPRPGPQVDGEPRTDRG